MAAHTQRHALYLLLPVNTVALGIGLAVAQGAIALPAPPPPVEAAAPAAPAALLPLLSVPVEPEALPPRPTPPTPTAVPVPKAPPAAEPAEARRPHVTSRTRVPRTSFEQEVRRQVARIPLYQPGIARWVVIDDLAVYGVTSLRTNTVYLSPRIPRKLLYSVVAHEWGHIISTHAYGGDLRASQQAFKTWFGGGSMKAATERAADCIAVLLGASWTHYTSCGSERWRMGALYLANGMRLPKG